jgi:phosphoglycerate kinase
MVTDDFRIRAAMPTIVGLADAGAVVIVASHLGRPEGPDPNLSLRPVATLLEELSGRTVSLLPGVVGAEVEAAVDAAGPGSILMLENTRFERGEMTNDPQLGLALAGLADAFVLDAFGSAHRAHASTAGVAAHIRSYAGPLVLEEIRALDRLLHDPDRPYTVVLGGAKVSTKLGVMRALLPKVDLLLVGGGMCFTLLAADGYETGDSLVERELLEECRDLLQGDYGARITLPTDIVVADDFSQDADHRVFPARDMPGKGAGLDVGPATAELFAGAVAGSDSVFWNGPMGVFEWEAFRGGTETLAQAMGETEAFTVVGGGDTVAAVRQFGVESDISFVSTGGGAGLEYLEKGTLPALEALLRWS